MCGWEIQKFHRLWTFCLTSLRDYRNDIGKILNNTIRFKRKHTVIAEYLRSD